MLPERTRHLDFGAVAAAWGLLADLGVAAVIDEETGARPPGLPLSPGTYLALAALNRVVDPCSKRGFADWWRTTAADRFTKIPVFGAGSPPVLGRVPRGGRWRRCRGIEEKLALAGGAARSGLDASSVALDIVVLDTPSRPNKRAATCGNATPGRSLTFQVRPGIVRHDLPPAGDWKVCGGRWGSSPGEGGSAGAFGWAA